MDRPGDGLLVQAIFNLRHVLPDYREKKEAADSIGPEKDLTDHKVTAGRAL